MTICGPCGVRSQGSREIQMEKMPFSINASLGQNVTLPCVLAKSDNQKQELNLSNVDVRWMMISMDGSEINVYKRSNGKGDPIRQGSAIDDEELRRGNASLTLHHVQRSDEGNYTCKIFSASSKGTAEINLQLFAQPDVTLSTSKLTAELGDEKFVTCDVTGFYPKRVKISWRKFNASSNSWSLLDKKTFRSEPEENSDGSFNVSSLLVVAPRSSKEDGDLYACVVTHESLSHDQNSSITLEITGLLSIFYNWILIINPVFTIPLLVVLLVRLVWLSYQVLSRNSYDIKQGTPPPS
ncbi:natural cytotoxicity triggering receptor 3 ligand 1-like [Mantella aurantiaca]